MPGRSLSRDAEAAAVSEFLASACSTPAVLVVEGEAGIGKTTFWSGAVEQARDRGFVTLWARAAAAESELPHGTLADLLAGVDPPVLAGLPDLHRRALDRVLLRANTHGEATDQRTVSVAFLSVLEALAERSPVLVAIDDLQWLDSASAQVLTFAVQRLGRRVQVLATVRTDPDGRDAASWLASPGFQDARRIQLGPMSIGDLQTMLTTRLGQSLPRSALLRIDELSAGNPLYAVELGQVVDAAVFSTDVKLPATLAEPLRARIGRLDDAAGEALLAVACLAAPTLASVAAAAGTDVDSLVVLLAKAQERGIVRIDGDRVRFTHPLLAHSVYGDAEAMRRRRMHLRLSAVVEDLELRARHLALASVGDDPDIVSSLDDAAEMARLRGAPSAAAELLELAVGLGGDTAERRTRCARDHLDAGDVTRAGALLTDVVDTVPPGLHRAQALCAMGRVHLSSNDLRDAIDVLRRALAESGDQLPLRVEVLTTLSLALVNTGDVAAALDVARKAVTDAERLGQPHQLSQALSIRAMMAFIAGEGLDEPALRRAVELEDRDSDLPLVMRPGMHSAILLSWTGHLDEAREELAYLNRRCTDRGEEAELQLIAHHSVMADIWRGNLPEAAITADEAMRRAVELGGDVPLCQALSMRAAVAAHAGRVDQARDDAVAAVAASRKCGSHRNLATWPLSTLGFLALSIGDHQSVLTSVAPLLGALETTPGAAEIVVAGFVPDVVEALIGLGRLDEAGPLIERLDRDGRLLDRPWLLSVGARCRSMLAAARGDLEAANHAARQAMAEHQRLPMPFERARTQLLMGQLLRRQLQEDSAAASLREALDAFDAVGTPLWAERARAELARTGVDQPRSGPLTASERRVAELAAAGMSNREIAAALFISPKTVDVNLYRVYRKLGIRSRGQLSRRSIGVSDS